MNVGKTLDKAVFLSAELGRRGLDMILGVVESKI